MNKYEKTAELCKILSNSKRIEILILLSEKEMIVTDLVEKMKIRKANVSQHLALLRHTGLVKSQREGKMIRYRLVDSKAVNLVKAIQKI
jgi:ArsR family transcriptional regulator